MNKKILYINLGNRFEEAKTCQRENPDQSLTDFIKTYSPIFPKDRLPSDSDLKSPLESFIFQPINLLDGECIEKKDKYNDSLRQEFNTLWQAEHAGQLGDKKAKFPDDISEAVRTAYCPELDTISDFLRNDLSVLVACDKMLTEYTYKFVCERAGRKYTRDTDTPEDKRQGMGSRLDQAMQGGQCDPLANLSTLFHNLKDNEVLVLRSLDMLDNPSMIELLYQHTATGKKPQVLAFLDPSLEAKKVLTDRFSVHVAMMGLPRYVSDGRRQEADGSGQVADGSEQKAEYCVSRLLTRTEHACFSSYDPEGLYKNVAGLNAIQFRNAMQYVGAKVAPGTDPKRIYQVIRHFKTSSSGEIEIPDTEFEHIGGYDHVKHKLKQIIALIAGPIQGMDDRQRGQLLPRDSSFTVPRAQARPFLPKLLQTK